MKSYEDFCHEVSIRIADALPDELADVTVELRTVVKGNDVHRIGLAFCDGSNFSPTIYLTPMYAAYMEGKTIDSILKYIIEVYQECRVQNSLDLKWLENAEMIKSNISAKLVNAKYSSQYLEDKPYDLFNDLAVVYVIFLKATDIPGLPRGEGICSITITNDIMRHLGLSKDELRALATKTIDGTFTCEHISNTLFRIAETFPEPERSYALNEAQLSRSAPMYVLSNKYYINGAVCMTSENVMRQVYHKIGSFYILPSSRHEVLIMPAFAVKDFTEPEIISLVREVNAEMLSPDDVLSNNIYKFDGNRVEIITQ